MRKRIADRLSFKVFVITFVVQILFGTLLCVFLYNATPHSWNKLKREEMEKTFSDFAHELEDHTLNESGIRVDQFIRTHHCDIVLYDTVKSYHKETLVPIPNSVYSLKNNEQIGYAFNKYQGLVFSENVNIKFKDDPTLYSIACIWEQKDENVLKEAIRNALPLIIAAIILISVACSFIYAYLFARPVRKLSEISGKMSDMDFSVRSNSKRRDEIGDLGRDLDELSDKLDKTITSLNNRTKELETEIARVNELERQKDVFFAAASHELKTPITIAQGQVRGMIDGIEPYNDTDTYLPKTLSSLKRMESLINEILIASRMQAGNEIELCNVDMGSVLNGKLNDMRDLFEVRNVTLESDIGEGLFFEGNADLTSMALGSLLSNAVFYTSEGSTVKVSSAAEDGKIVTYIRNTNAHIDEKDLPHLFEAFYRTDSSRDRRSGGSGLGLYLSKLIIERQNGSVSLENDGSDVVASVTLPLST